MRPAHVNDIAPRDPMISDEGVSGCGSLGKKKTTLIGLGVAALGLLSLAAVGFYLLLCGEGKETDAEVELWKRAVFKGAFNGAGAEGSTAGASSLEMNLQFPKEHSDYDQFPFAEALVALRVHKALAQMQIADFATMVGQTHYQQFCDFKFPSIITDTGSRLGEANANVFNISTSHPAHAACSADASKPEVRAALARKLATAYPEAAIVAEVIHGPALSLISRLHRGIVENMAVIPGDEPSGRQFAKAEFCEQERARVSENREQCEAVLKKYEKEFLPAAIKFELQVLRPTLLKALDPTLCAFSRGEPIATPGPRVVAQFVASEEALKKMGDAKLSEYLAVDAKRFFLSPPQPEPREEEKLASETE